MKRYLLLILGTSLRKILKFHPTKRISASLGLNSSAKCILGKPGDDMTIKSPTGVTIYNEYGKQLGNFYQQKIIKLRIFRIMYNVADVYSALT